MRDGSIRVAAASHVHGTILRAVLTGELRRGALGTGLRQRRRAIGRVVERKRARPLKATGRGREIDAPAAKVGVCARGVQRRAAVRGHRTGCAWREGLSTFASRGTGLSCTGLAATTRAAPARPAL